MDCPSRKCCRPAAKKDKEAYSRPLARYLQHTPKRITATDIHVEGIELSKKQAIRVLYAFPPPARLPGGRAAAQPPVVAAGGAPVA